MPIKPWLVRNWNDIVFLRVKMLKPVQ